MANTNLTKARSGKNDEFYTQWMDIEKEVNAYLEYDENVFKGKTILLPCDDPEWSNFTKFFAQNFTRLGLRKLISTSFAADSNPNTNYEPAKLETESKKFNKAKTRKHGKVFTLTHDKTGNGKVDFQDLDWTYLEEDGDFRSPELKKLRDEADIIITNPPFSLFREFLAWIGGKRFLVIGNMNAITYKETFPLLKNNEMWLGNGFHAGNAYFASPYAKEYGEGVYNPETGLIKFRNVCWFTNLDHGRRHRRLELMTKEDNLKFSKHKEIKETGFLKYDNYDAIEIPFTDAIPSNHKGVMGVPISFLDKYCPEQFEIIGMSANGIVAERFKLPHFKKHNEPYINGRKKYQRIFIIHKSI